MTVLDITALAKNVQPSPFGWYTTASAGSAISYPSDGNDVCFQLEDDSFWFQHRNAVLCSVLKLFPPGGPIVDVGGGNGCVTQAFEQSGFPTILVEPGTQGVANAVKRGLRQVVNATVETVGFAPGSLAAVGLFDVLEHIEDDQGFLLTLQALLAPAGKLYLTVPALSWLWSAADVEAGHFRRYTLKKLRTLLTQTGWQLDFASYFFSVLVGPTFLARSVPSFLGLRKPTHSDLSAKEHAPRQSFAGRCLQKVLKLEANWLAQGRRVPLGSSCLVVARKMQ